jgi:hypothetical protein
MIKIILVLYALTDTGTVAVQAAEFEAGQLEACHAIGKQAVALVEKQKRFEAVTYRCQGVTEVVN